MNGLTAVVVVIVVVAAAWTAQRVQLPNVSWFVHPDIARATTPLPGQFNPLPVQRLLGLSLQDNDARRAPLAMKDESEDAMVKPSVGWCWASFFFFLAFCLLSQLAV